MGFKLFDELSIEEVVAPVATESTLAIEDVMEADIATEEVQEVAAEIAAYGRAIEDGESVAARLEDQIAVESALVAEPEKVAASTVALSYESLKVTAAVLGADLGAMSISTEAMEKSPVSALEISIEEKESFLKKVAAKIKAIIAKVMVSLKKLGAKILVATNGLEKKAGALAAKVEKDYNEGKLSDADKTKLAKLNGTALEFGLSFGDVAKASNIAVSANETMARVLNIIIEKLSKLKLTNGEVNKGDIESFSKDTVMKLGSILIDDIAKISEVGNKITEAVNKDPKKYGITPLEAKEGSDVMYGAVRYDGTALKVIAVRFPNVPPKADTYGELLKKVMELTEIKYLTGSVKVEDVVKNMSDAKLKKAEVISTLKDLEKAGKNLKGYSKSVFKGLDLSNTMIKAFSEIDLGKATSSLGKVSGWITTANTAVTTDSILGVYRNIANTLAAMNIMASGKAEKKEDKKEEK